MYQMLEKTDLDVDKEMGIGLFQSVSEENTLMGPPEKMQPDLHFSGNDTGLPDNLRSGIEAMSGYSMGDVKVHYHSDKPVKMGAAAYTQGTEIYVAPGQERFLPHESWHVIQQFQGRVKPTSYENGVSVNESESLEQEADRMGKRALSFRPQMLQKFAGTPFQKPKSTGMPPCQKKITEEELDEAKRNITQTFANTVYTLENENEVFEDILALSSTSSELNHIVSQIISIPHNKATNMNVQAGKAKGKGQVFTVRHFNGPIGLKVIWEEKANFIYIFGVYRHHNDGQHYEIVRGPGPDYLAITKKNVTTTKISIDVEEPEKPKKPPKKRPPKKRK